MKAYRNAFITLVLLCLLNPLSARAAVCDVDADSDVDIDDIQAILAARNQPASGPDDPRDADGDGVITILDARTCVVQCTLPLCERPSTTNQAPVANAGPDQTAFVGDIVTLNGGGSSDADGDPLTFSWSLSAPTGSVASLSDPTAVAPTFSIDLPGDYVATLVVDDGTAASAPDSVTVSTLNSPPVADAGPDQSAFVLDTITLDGAGSSDVDGDPLTFSWSLTPPAGSSAILSDPSAVMPTFSIDVFGDYDAQLVVNDGLVDSAPDTVTVSTLNSPPVADAGPDQSAFVFDTVTLNGGGSSDVNGDPLTFSWSLTTPAGSSAVLSDPSTVAPTFFIDTFGDYVAQLVVNDGLVDSAPDTVTVSTLNSPPVADPGPNQTARVGDTVTVDGSGSSDVDGNSLTFFWSLTRPAGSIATLSDPTAVAPTFVLDAPGDYVVQLIVNDGLVGSTPATATVSTLNSAPVAGAGPDQTVFVLDTVTLDGNGSFDVDGDALSFSWSLSAPVGSTATLSSNVSSTPSFVVDVPGDYIAQLIVNDGLVGSAPDTVTVSTQNSAPIADAGEDQTASVGDSVTLDGSGSSDVDGDPLSFFWSLTSPAGSSAEPSDPVAVDPTFFADFPGDYVAQLIVNDGLVDSAPDTSRITVSVLPALTVSGAAVPEGDLGATTNAIFEVVLSPASPVTVTVEVQTVAQSASEGVDYQPVPPTVLTFAPGETLQTIPVSVLGDDLVELDEAFLVQISNPVNAVIASGMGTGTILNDDAATLAIDDVALAEGNTGAFDFVFTVALDNAVDGGLTVDYASADGSATSADGDYGGGAAGTLTFTGTAGETQTVTVSVNGDLTVELDEDFSVLLSNLQAGGQQVTLADDAGLGTIINDDTATLVIDDVSLAEGDADTTDFVFTVTLDNAVDGGLTVDYASADGSATSADGDYVGTTPGTLNFAGNAGETQTVTVSVNGDLTVELDEDFSVLLSNLQAGGLQVLLSDNTGLGTILNDDAAALAIDDVALAEGNAGVTDFVFTVTLNGAVDGGLTVDYASADGSATSADGDYVDLAPGTLTFTGTAGETQTVTVEVNGDDLVELDEDFSVLLSNLQTGGQQVTLADDAGLGTIINDEAATLVIDDVTLDEGDADTTDFVFTVTLDNAVDGGLTVDYASVDGSASSADGDYVDLAPGTLTFTGTAGETQTVTVEVNGDDLVELDEDFSVLLSNLQAGGQQVTLADDTGLGTIVNDEAATLVIDDVTLDEGDVGTTNFVFTVTLDNAVDAGLTVDFASADSSATTADNDYADANGTLTFSGNAGETQNITVQVNGDTVVELDEGFSMVLSNLQAAGRAVTVADFIGLGSIGNDDSVTISIGDVSQAEGDAATSQFQFDVTLTGTAAIPVSLTADTADGSATAGSDYVALTGVAVDFAPGETSSTIIVEVTGDTEVEPGETFFVNLSTSQSSVVLSDAQGQGTIDNDDAALTIDDVTLAEGSAGTTDFVFTVSIAQPSLLPVSATAQTADGTATAVSGDYLPLPPTVIDIPAGDTSTTVTVQVNGDTDFEPDENFFVDLSAPVNASIADPQGLGIIQNDDVALAISNVTLAEGDSGTTDFVFTVSIAQPSLLPVSATAQTADGTATAASGDYLPLPPTMIDIPAGDTSTTVTVQVNGDTDFEPDENFFVDLSAPVNASIADPQGLGIIQNDDVALAISNVTLAEGDSGTTDFIFTVSITQASLLPVSATAQTADGTATAASGDYLPLAPTVIDIPAGDTSTTVTVQVNGDTDSEPDETFFVDLSAPVNASIADPQGLGTIQNDDATLPGIGLAIVAGGPPVGVTRSATALVTLGAPAPAGGVTVAVSSDAPSILGVAAPGTISIPAGGSTGSITVNGVGEGNTALRANASGYLAGSLVVPVTLNLISIPETLTVPLGQTTSLPVSITPNPAPAGGLVIQLSGSNPAAVDIQTPSVTIPAGQFSANAIVFGAAPGNSSITASNPSYAPDAGVVTTSADLNILQGSLTINDTLPDDITIQLEVGGSPISAPAPGINVTVASDNPSCVAATSPVVIPTGLVNTTSTISYGGSATLPCTANVIVSAPSIVSDTLPVTVNPAPGFTMFGLPVTVGAGLQANCCTARLGSNQHGGVTVRIESLDPSVALVSPDLTTPGTAFIDVFVANGFTDVSYDVQGLEGQVGNTAAIQASAPGFNNGNGTASVVQPALDIIGLIASLDTLDPDDPFNVRVGIPNGTGSALGTVQTVRAGAPGPQVISVNSSAVAVGDLVTSALVADSVTVEIPVGSSVSPTGVTNGGIAFRSISAGTTTVTATATGLITTGNGSQSVTVTNPMITTFGLPVTVGAGLQANCCTARLGANQHGGVTVRIESLDPSVALISPDLTTPGTPFIDVFVANGFTDVSFDVQGLEGQAGNTANIQISAPGFGTASSTAPVVQPALDIISLIASLDTLDPDDPFIVRLGIPNGTGSALGTVQTVRAGAPGPQVISVNSSAVAVGDLVTSALVADSVTVEIPVGSSVSPSGVTNGGIAFRSISAGTTTVTATATGLITTGNGSQSVTVTNPMITTFGLPVTVGAGLQANCCTARLGANQHGGVTVRIESLDPSVALISPDLTTPGTPFIDVFVANGFTDVSFDVQGLEGQAGNTANIQISAPGFGTASSTAPVVQPALDINGLASGIDTLDTDDPFIVRIGIPNSTASALGILQTVRAGAPAALIATVDSSVPSFGRLITSTLSGSPVTVEIPIGSTSSANTVASGGVAFEALTTGTTVVSATIPGFLSTTNGSQNVTVTTPTITMLGLPTTVGAGLQRTGFSARLGATDHGGVDVTITSSNPAVALVAPDASSPGVASFTTNVPNGSISVNFVVQGIEGALGTVQVTGEASGFLDGSGTVTVVQPALDIVGLNLTAGASGADDDFTVRLGIPNATATALSFLQNVRTGGTAVSPTVTSSDPAVGQLVTTSTTGGSVTLTIPIGSSQTPGSVATGGVALDPLAPGSTTVEATIPGFITTGNGTRTVTVGP